MDALVNESEDNTTNAQIAELQEEIDTIIDILDADLLLIETLEANLSAVADDLNAAVTNISTVAADLNAVETQLAALDARVTTLETAVTNINQMLDQHTVQIAMLEADHMVDIYMLQAEHDIDIDALEAELENATSCQLVPFGNCADADLSGADLSGMDLTGIVLRSANLEG
ncbi:MAG: pentapeptide repeat-containing protein, partial [Candidatus Poseidoniia archaeon]|nr:pentapeptide repeat-containing protein [Candidatus Poseidoniia archaeon]